MFISTLMKRAGLFCPDMLAGCLRLCGLLPRVGGAAEPVNVHNTGFPDLSGDSDYGQWSYFLVLRITSDRPDLCSFAPAAPQGPSLVSEGSSDPPGHVDVGDSGPGPPVRAFFTMLRLPDFPSNLPQKRLFRGIADVLYMQDLRTLSAAGPQRLSQLSGGPSDPPLAWSSPNRAHRPSRMSRTVGFMYCHDFGTRDTLLGDR